ncbi:MAG: pyridoxal 5'-phosphate synthase glutaminase subunit PdxT [Actinobacteria bacterium]|nr:pyridoxal 5'-phosphate synthase glutaminase subunit PdxT [Actinomycetota bacterium]
MSREGVEVIVGVLALQGAVEPHVAALSALGAKTLLVRSPDDVAGIDALVIPGGESTTMSMLLESSGLRGPIGERLDERIPVLGTCAGMVLLASTILDGRSDQHAFGAIDITVRRNAFGRQVDSFEADLRIASLGEAPFHAVFIRAPCVEDVGDKVEVVATLNGHPVFCRQGSVLVTAFHPELVTDLRVHDQLLQLARRRTEVAPPLVPTSPL